MLPASSFTSGGVIKSIQRGTVTVTAGNGSATAAIAPVDPTKSELRMLVFSTACTVCSGSARLTLGSTTVTITTESNTQITASWELTERY